MRRSANGYQVTSCKRPFFLSSTSAFLRIVYLGSPCSTLTKWAPFSFSLLQGRRSFYAGERRDRPQPVNSTPDPCCGKHKRPIFTLRNGIRTYVHAANSTLRAHAAKKPNSQNGLKADVRKSGRALALPFSRPWARLEVPHDVWSRRCNVFNPNEDNMLGGPSVFHANLRLDP